jgi:hypothetical protein
LQSKTVGRTQQVWFEEVCLWKQKPEAWWDFHPGLMALYPLCNHGLEAAPAVVHAAEANRHRELDSLRRADLLTTLGIFGRLKHSKLDVFSIIGREQMRESSFFQQVADEAKVEKAREDVLEVVRVRWGEEAVSEFQQAINQMGHEEQLKSLLQLAVKSRRITQFRKGMPHPERAREN